MGSASKGWRRCASSIAASAVRRASRTCTSPSARHRSDGAIVVEQTLSGRHTGQWLRLAPTGRSFEVQVCTVYLFDEGGKLAAEHVYFDLGWLERQLTR
jgi:hypothetical protein